MKRRWIIYNLSSYFAVILCSIVAYLYTQVSFAATSCARFGIMNGFCLLNWVTSLIFAQSLRLIAMIGLLGLEMTAGRNLILI